MSKEIDRILKRVESVEPETTFKLAEQNAHQAEIECKSANPPFIADYVKMKLQQFDLVVCGAPRTGKSTLINAILNKEVALAKPGVEAVTQQTECYPIKRSCPIDPSREFRINIWDTKGITTWDENLSDRITNTKPMCLIICSSPGSYAKDDCIRPLIEQCIKLKVFVVLVCTNKHHDSDAKRQAVMEEFHGLLERHHKVTDKENDVTYYGNIGLTAMINSVPYENKQMDIYEPASGVNTLIYAIMKSLNEHQLLGWCYTVMENDGFLTEMGAKIVAFFGGNFTYGKSILWSLVKRLKLSYT